MRPVVAYAGLFSTVVTLAAGCAEPGQPAAPPAPPSTSQSPSYGPNVVNYEGAANMRFGDTERDLTDRGVVVRDLPQCGPRMAEQTGASPVFVAGRLALIWADPPLRTPEGIGVGAPVANTRETYPAATELTAPAGSYRFHGLLATRGDRAYLFLHDGKRVQKLIVGYTQPARRLFQQGFVGC